MPESQQHTLSELSNEIARVYKARYGHGPTRITSHLQDDAVLCLLRGVNTPAQRSLVGYGRTAAAQTVHGELQMGMADEMAAAVERVVGRTVVAYVPGFNAEADASTDVFLLQPEQDGDAA